jgi:superfamily I DNA and/or RNA helicase
VNLIKKQYKIIFPLNKQLIEVSTVDGFQGREKEVIIISMVRSNPYNEIGFLQNERRMNVAVTRAKRLCAIVADSFTVSKNPFLKGLVDYFKQNGAVRSAFDYNGNPDVRIMYGNAAAQSELASLLKKQKKADLPNS